MAQVKKLILLSLLTTFPLFSQDLLEIYRNKGAEAVIDQLEKRLGSEKYWLQKLKDINGTNLKWGYYEGKRDILVCVKDKKILSLYKVNGSTNTLHLIDKIKVLTGLPGEKRKEGDRKTPIGVYRLKKILKKVDQFYGPFAFETSYPNPLDRSQHRTGHGIWLHGVPLKGKRESNTTKGCIVMPNPLLRRLRTEIDYRKTYLLVAEKNVTTATKGEIAKILAFLYRWRRSRNENNFTLYKKFYSPQFKTPEGKGLKTFFRKKKGAFERGRKTQILFKDIAIVPYQTLHPTHSKIFQVDITELHPTKHNSFVRKPKRLYIKLTNSTPKIILEK